LYIPWYIPRYIPWHIPWYTPWYIPWIFGVPGLSFLIIIIIAIADSLLDKIDIVPCKKLYNGIQ